jgi:O-acetyl-ADP-ribose deacetylase
MGWVSPEEKETLLPARRMMDRYAIGDSLLELQHGDITQEETAAVGNAAHAMLRGGGGVDGAIHRAAGARELQQALHGIKSQLPGGVLHTGGAVITPGFGLAAKSIIHCVGPIYERDGARAPKLLASCYRTALRLCRENGIGSVAFPSISTGVYGYPVAEAAEIALRTVRGEVAEHGRPALTRFVLFDEKTLNTYREAAALLFASPD